jgi:hypothetical protein
MIGSGQERKLLPLTSLIGRNKEVWGHGRERFLDVSDYRRPAIAHFDNLKTKAVAFDWQPASVGKVFPSRIVKLSVAAVS